MKLQFKIDEQQINDTPISLLPLDDVRWESYYITWSSIKESLADLIKNNNKDCDKVHEMFHDICDMLTHQLSFYKESYLIVPYLVQFLKTKGDDFEWQFQIISELGIIISTDNKMENQEKISDQEILAHYNHAISVLKEITKKFIMEHLEEITVFDEDKKIQFATACLAIFDDHLAAEVMLLSSFDEIYTFCHECDDYNEEINLISDGEIDEIEPAKSVIGQWDGESFDDTYVWFSNFLSILGCDTFLNALSYYYGTYTCPQCNAKGLTMDFIKNYYMEQ